LLNFNFKIRNDNFVDSTLTFLMDNYSLEIYNGLIEIIIPNKNYYKDYKVSPSHVDIIFNDKYDRVNWRTKQVYDISFLMLYSSKRGDYYLQVSQKLLLEIINFNSFIEYKLKLEDDVESLKGFVSTMDGFIDSNDKENVEWRFLEMSSMGFIGKLMRTNEIPSFVIFSLLFAQKKPSLFNFVQL
jgi:hypothetical protein